MTSTDRRGAEVFATDLARELGGPPDHVVLAIQPGASSSRLEIGVLGARRFDIGGFFRLVRHLRRADVLVAHGSSALIHGGLASALARRPFVYRNIGDPSAWGRVRWASIRIGLPLRRAAAVSAIYPAARDHLIEAYGLDASRVVVIPNGVPDVGVVDADLRSASRAQWDLDPALTWVGFVGALSEEKGVLAAIEAVALDAHLGLLIAGGGPQDTAARAMAGERLVERVCFVGVLDGSRSALAAIDVLVVPSRTEGIPAIAIEAGLAGVPVVATDVGGVSTVVVDGVTGVLVGTAEPAQLLAGINRALAGGWELGTAARAHCLERFTLEAVAGQWAGLLERVVARGRTTSR